MINPPTVKRNSRIENFQWIFEGISAAREFRRNIEHIKAERYDESEILFRLWCKASINRMRLYSEKLRH